MWPSRGLEIWLYRRPVDMRKSYDGLSALTKHVLNEDPLSGALFVFINKRRSQLKCLYFEGDGYCVWSKRLERGRFQINWSASEKVRVDVSTLQFLIEGIVPESVRRVKRYHHPQRTANHVQ